MKLKDTKEYEFAVVFFNDAKKIKVFDKNGKPVKRKRLIKSPLNKINKLDTLQVGHSEGKSPCCVVWGGWKYCWCDWT
jgi:hypothetical protein